MLQDDWKHGAPEPDTLSSELDQLKSKAKQLFEKGNSLQALECYSEILDICPENLEALEGRLAVCFRLKLFHRCLRDIDVLTSMKSDDSKIQNLSGFIHEQVGAYDKSLRAYLSVYLLDDKSRLETIKNVSKICHFMIESLDEDLKEEKITPFELLILLSEKLFQAEKFQACANVLVTTVLAHCLDETALKTFREELHESSVRDNRTSEKLSITSNSNIDIIKAEAFSDSLKYIVTADTFSEELNSRKDNMKAEISSETSNSPSGTVKDETSEKLILDTDNTKTRTSPRTSDSAKIDIKEKKFFETSSPQKDTSLLTSESRNITFLETVDCEIIHNALFQISECYNRVGRLQTSLWFAGKSLEYAQLSQNFLHELKICSKLANLHEKSDKPEQSIFYYRLVLLKCRSKVSSLSDGQLDGSLRSEISVVEREILLKLCLLLKELELYREAEKIAREYLSKVEIVDQENLVKAYRVLGELERFQGLHVEAIKSHRTELALCLKFNDRRGIATAYSNLGKVYQATGKSVLAMEYHDLHLKMATTWKDKQGEAIAYGHLGEGFRSRGNPEEALPCFEEQLKLATACNQRHLCCQALRSLGVTYQQMKLFQHAEVFLKKALLEARDRKLYEEHTIKQSLIEVLRSLGNSSETLPLLFERHEYLESKFNRIRGFRILARHPTLDELNRSVDDILELLADLGRHEDALALAERSNSLLFHQMIKYKAFVEGSELDASHRRHHVPSFSDLYQLVNARKKVLLFYHVLKNGYMTWVVNPSHQGVTGFYWHRSPSGSSFRESFATRINGLLTPRDPCVLYSCDDRKIRHTSREASSVGPTEPEVNPAETADSLLKLSKLFLFPIERFLDTDPATSEIVVVKNSFLNLIPFSDLYTSSGLSLQDLSMSVQVLPCVSVLEILDSCNRNSCKQIRVLGNPEVTNIPGSSFVQPESIQLELLEEELGDVSVLLGVKAEVGKMATKEDFLLNFSSTSLLHLSTYGSHDDGIIALSPVNDVDPRALSDHAWTITLEDIVALRQGPEVVVLNSCYGCRNQFRDLQNFDLAIPLAFMVAGVKSVVMPTWSVPQKALLASMREFYKNLSGGFSVTSSLLKTKKYLQSLESFQEPVFWSSFNLYGGDSRIPVKEIRRHAAEDSFDKVRETAMERFECGHPHEGWSSSLICDCLVETLIDVLQRHHLHPTLLPTLLDVVREAADVLQNATKNSESLSLPYREITRPWISLILRYEKFLTSIGFLIKSTSSQQTVLIYPHWNSNRCLEKVMLVLQSVTDILECSPILADGLRVLLSQENKYVIAKFGDVLKQTLSCPEAIVQIHSHPSVRMFWLKRSTHRIMDVLGFREVGSVLDFRNGKKDRHALDSCVKVFTILSDFEADLEFKSHPMVSQANLRISWKSRRASNQENKAKLLVAQSLDDINSRYKLAMNDVKKWHKDVLLTQAKVTKAQTQKLKARQKRENFLTLKSNPESPNATVLPRTQEVVDLTKFGGHLTKVKVQSGSSPSCIRVPVAKKQELPLIECVMKRHESYNALYKCLRNIKTKKQDEIKKLVSF